VTTATLRFRQTLPYDEECFPNAFRGFCRNAGFRFPKMPGNESRSATS
jgi:hypothetical protein